MDRDSFTRNTKKFNTDQSVKTFPGNTIISMIEHDKPVFDYLLQLKAILQSKSACECFTFLPESSYHMTIIEGVCEQVREKSKWSSHLSLDTKLAEVDDYFENQFKKVQKLGTVTMCGTNMYLEGGITMHCKPKNTSDAEKLAAYREQVKEHLGMCFPDHYKYQFHISLLYGTKKPSENQAKEIEIMATECTSYIKNNQIEFMLKEPNLMFFDTMFEFSPQKTKRF